MGILKNKKFQRKKATIHYYIDESGNPEFFGKRKKLLIGKEGYSPILIIGLVTIINRRHFITEIEKFKQDLLSDKTLKDIHSLHQPGWYLHAKDDHPDVRDRFFEFLSKKSFRGYFIIGRKKLEIFEKRHKADERIFYFDLIKNLLKDRFLDFSEYKIFLSRRSGSSINSFTDAIEASIDKYNNSTKKEAIKPFYSCSIVPSKNTPELSVVDYQLWALQRYIVKGDKKYFDMLKDKYCYIYDIYGRKRIGQTRYYNRENPFDLEKAEKF
jgi:hypothetical protein